MSYLQHLTLNSAHGRRSPREEVADDVVRKLTPTLSTALTGEHASLWAPSYQISGARHGRCAIITLWGHHTEGGKPERYPAMTIGIAGHSRCGATLWRELWRLADEEGLKLAADRDRTPGVPWVADLLHAGYALDPAAGEWTGDFSRCIAWTWMEMRGTNG